MRANPIQASFTAGEVSPSLRGRVDTQKYASGCAKLKNLMVKPQGPLKRRPGTEYYSEAAAGGNLPTRLVDFNNTFVVEFSDQLITIKSKTLGTAYGTGVVSVATPYLQAQLWDIVFDVAGNIMYLTHGSHHPRKLWNPYDFRGEPRPAVAPYGWELIEVEFIDGPYFPTNDLDSVRMTVSNMVDSATLRSTNAVEFAAADVGKYVEFFYENEWRLSKITSVPVNPGPTAIVDIQENVLIFLDPNVRVTPKAENTPRDTGNTTTSPAPITPNRGGLFLPAGSEPRYAQPLPVYRNYLDRSTPITVEVGATPSVGTIISQAQINGLLNSTHSQVFSRSDIGKWIRAQTVDNLWRLITGFKSDSAVTFNNVIGGFAAVFKVPVGTLTIDMKSRLITATLTATLPTVGGPTAVFYATDVGRHIRLNYSGHQIWAKVTAYTSATVVSIKFYDPFPRNPQDARKLANNGMTDLWRWGSWSARTGYPACVCIHEQRLFFAASRTEPQTFWASCSADFERMAPTELDSTVLDDNGFTYILASAQPQEIMWMAPGPVLLIGTRTGEWQIKSASSISEPLTPTNIVAQSQTPHGSCSRNYVKVDNTVIHIDRTGKIVRELSFSFEQDSWVSRDLTIISDHMLRNHGGAKELIYQQSPNSIIWARLADGTLAAMTYVRDQEVIGWHWHTFEDNQEEEPNVYSIVSIQPGNEMDDRLYMCIQREIGGSFKYYLEALADEFFYIGQSAVDKVKYVDSAVTSVVAAGNFVTGLAHLNGKTVWATQGALGVYHERVVAGGQIDIGAPAVGTWVVGLPMNSLLKTLPPEGGSQFGTSQGKTKKIPHIDVRFSYSYKVKHGVLESALTEDQFAGATLAEIEDRRFSVEGQWDTGIGYFLGSVGPHPLTIVALAPDLLTTR